MSKMQSGMSRCNLDSPYSIHENMAIIHHVCIVGAYLSILNGRKCRHTSTSRNSVNARMFNLGRTII